VVFDELAIEARRRELRIPLCDSASVHSHFLWRLIMTRPAVRICEMIGKRSRKATMRAWAETAVTIFGPWSGG
jgi:hypothetical protein